MKRILLPSKGRLSRREFCRLASSGLVAGALGGFPLIGCGNTSSSPLLLSDGDFSDSDLADQDTLESEENRYFYFANLADTHIIDEYYDRQNPEDQIFKTAERLGLVRDFMNNLKIPIDLVNISGDFIHNYPSTDYAFYEQNRTRIDIAKDLIDGFNCPVHVGLGNHDYDVPTLSREFTHELFKEKIGIDPYYSFDHKGFRFIHLNNFLGDTYTEGHADFETERGSFGEEQLNWLEGLLQDELPTFIFFHFAVKLCNTQEVADLDIHFLLEKYKHTIKLVTSGHTHMWVDFEHKVGPRHMIMASTRYDPDCYMIIKVDRQTQDFEILNENCFQWYRREADPYLP